MLALTAPTSHSPSWKLLLKGTVCSVYVQWHRLYLIQMKDTQVDMDVLLLELMSSALAHGHSLLPTPHKAPEAKQAFSTATNHNSSSTMTTSEDPFFSYSHLNNFERHTISGRKIPCMLCRHHTFISNLPRGSGEAALSCRGLPSVSGRFPRALMYLLDGWTALLTPMDVTLSKLWQTVKDRAGWRAAVCGVTKRHYFTTEQQLCMCVCVCVCVCV